MVNGGNELGVNADYDDTNGELDFKTEYLYSPDDRDLSHQTLLCQTEKLEHILQV